MRCKPAKNFSFNFCSKNKTEFYVKMFLVKNNQYQIDLLFVICGLHSYRIYPDIRYIIGGIFARSHLTQMLLLSLPFADDWAC